MRGPIRRRPRTPARQIVKAVRSTRSDRFQAESAKGPKPAVASKSVATAAATTPSESAGSIREEIRGAPPRQRSTAPGGHEEKDAGSQHQRLEGVQKRRGADEREDPRLKEGARPRRRGDPSRRRRRADHEQAAHGEIAQEAEREGGGRSLKDQDRMGDQLERRAFNEIGMAAGDGPERMRGEEGGCDEDRVPDRHREVERPQAVQREPAGGAAVQRSDQKPSADEAERGDAGPSEHACDDDPDVAHRIIPTVRVQMKAGIHMHGHHRDDAQHAHDGDGKGHVVGNNRSVHGRTLKIYGNDIDRPLPGEEGAAIIRFPYGASQGRIQMRRCAQDRGLFSEFSSRLASAPEVQSRRWNRKRRLG